MSYLAGLDLSSVQGNLSTSDWATLKARGTRFIIAKCGNGNNRPDPDWGTFTAQARATGMVVGCYHFPFILPEDPNHPGRSPEDQAEAHFKACGGLGSQKGDLPATCDIEWPAPEQWWKPIPGVDNSIVTADFLRDGFTRYMNRYEELQQRAMIIYGYPWFFKNIVPPAEWATRPLWLANYSPNVAPEPPWAGWSLMQTSGGGGKLPDGAPVDTDVCVDESTLAALTG